MSPQGGTEMPTPASTQEANGATRNSGQPPMMSSQAMRDKLQQLFPPSTIVQNENTNRLGRVWKSYDDMDEAATDIADGLLGMLAVANKQQFICNETVRQDFWDNYVFASGWNTESTVKEPGKIRERVAAECSIRVGTIRIGMPPSKEQLKNNKETPKQRRPGQPVLLRPNINWDDYGLTFVYSDLRGSTINSRWVEQTPGYSPAQARADAIVEWDMAECRRVTRHNTDWVVYWARCRLIHWMKDFPGNIRADDYVGRPTRDVPREEDHSTLVKLRTCQMALDDITAVALEVRCIQTKRSSSEDGKIAFKS